MPLERDEGTVRERNTKDIKQLALSGQGLSLKIVQIIYVDR